MISIIIIGISIAAFTSLLFLSRRPLTSNDKTIAAFMLFLAMPMLEKLILIKVIDIPYLGFSLFFGSALTFGPFLYLYARSAIDPDSRISRSSLFHFIPFLASIGMLLLLPGGKMPPGGRDAAHAGAGAALGNIHALINAIIVLSLVVYTVLIFARLRLHRRKVPDYFSHDSISINLKWLNWVTVCFFVAYGIVIAGSQVFPGLGGRPLLQPQVAPDVGTAFFIIAFSFCALKQPALFKANPRPLPEPAPGGTADGTARKYEKSGLKEGDALKVLAMLEDHMRSARPWLDPDLTIEDVAAALRVPKHHVTQVINEKLHKNFYRYVNEYRIEEVKRRITGGDSARYSLLGIASHSGFNSKSAFNEAFRNIMNCTPSEYRKSVRP